MNLKRTNQANNNVICTINFDFPKILFIIAVLILLPTLIVIFEVDEEVGGALFISLLLILALLLSPFYLRSKKAYVSITDTSIIVNDYFFATYQKSYRLDTITNVQVTSFFGFNTLVLDFTQGDALKTKKLVFLLIKNPDDVYTALTGLIDCVKNDNDVLVELAEDNNAKLEQIARSIKNNNN